MNEPTYYPDQMDKDSLDDKQTLEDYLEWLQWMADELAIRISNVQRDVDKLKG